MDEIIRVYPSRRENTLQKFLLAIVLLILFLLFFIKRGGQSLIHQLVGSKQVSVRHSDNKMNDSSSSLDYDDGVELDFSNLPKGNGWRQIILGVPEKSCVLDVGCSTGYFGKYLIKNKYCIVDGIEIDKQAANEAIKFYNQVFIGRAEEMVSQLEINKYDAILLMDVLEHIESPSNHLCEYRGALRKDGIIIASVPNIAYWMMRFELLRGRFNYTRRGLLDQTHLRFFTLTTLTTLFTNSGYKINWIAATSPGWHDLYYLLKRLPGGESVKLSLLRIFPGLLSYQFLVCAEPIKS